ncbi:hypothetical protein FXO37_36599 [Capsicum annuum]|nr:hypothetical protein FXO37_36599 [Capsicum annuum]
MSKIKSQKTIEESRYQEDTPVLPFDIIFSILIKVNTTSLIRFKSVSKSWNAMISDITFTKTHYDRSKEIGCEKIVLQKSTGEFEFLYLNNVNEVIIDKPEFPLKEFIGAQILCSYDGLVLLKKPKAYKKFVLWNPPSGHHHILECPYMKPQQYTFCCAYGMCSDSITGDYKIILIYNLFYFVYSTSKNIWTKKTTLPTLQQCLPKFELSTSYTYMCSQGTGTDNRVYWALNEKRGQNVCKTSTFIYFDVNSDELKEFPTPHGIENKFVYRLSTLKGCLGAFGGNDYINGLYIWVMQQDGWRWFMYIPYIQGPTIDIKRNFSNYNLLFSTKSYEELVFQGPGCHTLSIYCLKQKKFVRTIYTSNCS